MSSKYFGVSGKSLLNSSKRSIAIAPSQNYSPVYHFSYDMLFFYFNGEFLKMLVYHGYVHKMALLFGFQHNFYLDLTWTHSISILVESVDDLESFIRKVMRTFSFATP